MQFDVANLNLAVGGKKRILWVDNDMSVLAAIRKRLAKSKPLKGKNISVCLHITAETANSARALRVSGANVVLCGFDPALQPSECPETLNNRYYETFRGFRSFFRMWMKFMLETQMVLTGSVHVRADRKWANLIECIIV